MRAPFFMLLSPVELSHAHYSAATQEAISVFKMTYAAWHKIKAKDIRENMIRLDSLQSCWNAVVLARIEETGVGLYLDEAQYKQAVANKNKAKQS